MKRLRKCSDERPSLGKPLYDPTNCHGKGVNDCEEYQVALQQYLASGGKGFNLPSRSKAIGITKLCKSCNDLIVGCQGTTYALHTGSSPAIHARNCCKACYLLDQELKLLLKNKERRDNVQERVATLTSQGKLQFRLGKSISDVVTATRPPIYYGSSADDIDAFASRIIPECFTSNHHSNKIVGSLTPMKPPSDQELMFIQELMDQIPKDNEDPKRFALSLHRKSITTGGYTNSSMPNIKTFINNSEYIKKFANATFNKACVFAGDGDIFFINSFFGEGRRADDSPLEGIEGLGIPGVRRLVALVNAITTINKNNSVTIVVADIVEVTQCFMYLIYLLLEFENSDQVFILARSSGNNCVSVQKWILHMLSMQAIDDSPEGT